LFFHHLYSTILEVSVWREARRMSTREDSGNKQLEENLEQAMFSYTAVTNLKLEEENKLLKETVNQLREELSRYKTPALMVVELVEFLGDKAVIRIANGNKFLVQVSRSVTGLKPGDAVLVEQKNLTVVGKYDSNANHNVEKFVIIEKPTLSWNCIGGLKEQVRELQEVIELPLKKPDLLRKVGINPPKGVLLYGPSGTGKTLLAKAVAASTHATFIEMVGSELVQKFIGEGAKLVKELFELARQKAPSIVFIDELDSIAARRVELGTSGEREVQRTFMQLLAEIDGFEALDNVKVIGCTNRKDILDPAILRPGRLDRQILVPNPDFEGVKEIFRIHTKNMNLARIDADAVCKAMLGFSGAEIKAVCTEAGYFAIRDGRVKVLQGDFFKAVEKVKQDEELDRNAWSMFG